MSKTLSQAFEEIVIRHAARPALRWRQNGSWSGYSYAEYGERARAVAMGLLDLGVGPGDRVAMIAENRAEWVIGDQGILACGGVTVPVYPTLTGKQSEYIINNCGARIAIVSSQAHLEKLEEVRDNLSNLTHIVVMGKFQASPGGFANVQTFDDLVALGRKNLERHGAELRRRIDAGTGENLATIVYTSGTTGEPKGAMLTHGNVYSNLSEIIPILGLNCEDSGLSFLPLSHVFERVANFAIVEAGGLVNFADSIDTVPRDLMEVKPTMFVSVPRLFEKIKARVTDKMATENPIKQQVFKWAMEVGREYDRAKKSGKGVDFGLALKHSIADRQVFKAIRERTGGKLRLCISGGAPLGADVGEFFGNIGLMVIEGYGLTETSPIITVNRPGDIVYGSVGKPIPGVQVRLAEDGELLCKGPNVMKGYWNNPDATAQAIDQDGWFHTGDVAVFDEAGRVKIVDRKKEILVMSNGKNVAPQPIENALKASNFIEQVMLIGDRRNFISAVIVPNFEALKPFLAEHRLDGLTVQKQLEHPQVLGLFQKEVTAACESFARYEQPKKFVLLPRAFDPARNELTPTLKVKRRVIAENFVAEIDGMYEAETVSA